MTKLIDSLCGVKAIGKRNRIQDSYNDVSPEKIAKAKGFIKEEADRPEDVLYVVMDYLYDSPVAIDTDRDVVDVEAKGYYWPNGDAFRSSVVKVNEPGVAMTSLWGSGNPRDLWFIPLPVAEICEIDDPKVTPGYYYLNGETNTIERIGETNEDLDKWVASLDTDETIETRKREFARKEQLGRDERRMSAEVSRENVEDSASTKTSSFLGYLSVESKSDTGIYSAKTPKGAVYLVESPVEPDNANSILVFSGNPSVAQVKQAISKMEGEDAGKALDESDVKEVVKSKVKVNPETNYELTLAPLSVSTKSKVSDAAYNPKFEKLRRVISDTTIVEELSHYMSSDELEEFTETLTRNYDIDLEEIEDSAK